MGRATIILDRPEARSKAQKWVLEAPAGTSVTFKRSKRSIDQNSRFWALLTDVATQKEHCGRKYGPDVWKILFMHAWGKEAMSFVQSLDDATIVPLGYHSSDLSKDEMTELMDFIEAWGAENGVQFHDPSLPAHEMERA